MFTLMVILFLVGYLFIALEHPIKVNKSATALLLAVGMWVIVIIGGDSLLVNPIDYKTFLSNTVGGTFMGWLVHTQLLHHLAETAEILFFLLGAMTIVETVDHFGGFRIITDRISTTKKTTLLWVIGILTFFMSAALDNLTTSIVMIALLRKLIGDKNDRWFFAGIVIVAANAGGAWSPIGDITTIMLWVAGKVTAVSIVAMTILPSLVSVLVPLAILSFTMKGHVKRPEVSDDSHGFVVPKKISNILFFVGTGSLLFVPVFKTVTHLPPYLGVLFGLGLIWLITELYQASLQKKGITNAGNLTVAKVLTTIDMPSILFFLGILMAVGALSTVGHLSLLATVLEQKVGNLYIINMIIGVLSAVVDNVPLVAAAMKMYAFPQNHYFWEFLAYCAGTGGSILIIGSAAGVAVMGMEKIDFIWYLKKISLLAFIGFLAGAGTYIIQEESGMFHSEDHAQVAIDINDKEAVLDYLTHTPYKLNMIDDQGDSLFHEVFFIRFEDKRDGKTESYLGYNLKKSDGMTAHWEGDLEEAKVELKPMGKDQVRITFLNSILYLRSDGELSGFVNGHNEHLKAEWNRSVEGGH